MRSLCLVVFAIFGNLLLIQADLEDVCDTDQQCRLDECCVQHWRPLPNGSTKQCRDKGDDIGDPCGGPYFCNDCDNGLVCTPANGTSRGNDRFNATCQPPKGGGPNAKDVASNVVRKTATAVGPWWDDLDEDDAVCDVDKQCKWDECCVLSTRQSRGGPIRRCRDRGDSIGEPCGGPHFCGQCDRGLVCTPLNRPTNGDKRSPQFYNSTCQPAPPEPETRGSNQRNGNNQQPDRKHFKRQNPDAPWSLSRPWWDERVDDDLYDLDDVCSLTGNASAPQCKFDECCVAPWAPTGRAGPTCRDKGDDIGDPCGGPHFCDDCLRGLVCTPVDEALAPQFKTRTPRPFKATCQPPVEAFRSVIAGPPSGADVPPQAGGPVPQPPVQWWDRDVDDDGRPDLLDLDDVCDLGGARRQCKLDECCVRHWRPLPQGVNGVCRDIGDDIGDPCGGPFFCDGCRKGLVCAPIDQQSAFREMKSEIARPFNATCQLPPPVPLQPQPSRRSGSFARPGERVSATQPDSWYLLRKYIDSAESTEVDDDDLCEVDDHCKWDECCVPHWRTTPSDGLRVCRDIGDDIGDPCGGPFFCGGCRHGLVCTPLDVQNIPPEFRANRPFNATCQPAAIAVNPQENVIVRRHPGPYVPGPNRPPAGRPLPLARSRPVPYAFRRRFDLDDDLDDIFDDDILENARRQVRRNYFQQRSGPFYHRRGYYDSDEWDD